MRRDDVKTDTPSSGSKTTAPGVRTDLRGRLHEVIFEADTPAGKAFDVVLLVAILASVLAVILESVNSIRIEHRQLLRQAEWAFTILFTLEYALRLATVRRPIRYAFSFYGLVDLLSIIPTYLSLLLPGTQSLLVIRALRLMRVFRVLKLARFVGEGEVIQAALRASMPKITVFLLAVCMVVLVVGAAMHLIEGDEAGFSDIPTSMYWAVVTMTTVGYGDITPQTTIGKSLAALVMITGYGIIAVPTGIVTAEFTRVRTRRTGTQSCPACGVDLKDPDARFCARCGAQLHA